MGAVEKSGLFQLVTTSVEKNGFYRADVIIEGSRIPGKTFFPKNWSREKVVNKIGEAYDNFIKSGASASEKGGKYIVDGLTNEGITIRMFITKNGQIATAYPKL